MPRNIKGKDLFDASLWKDELSTSIFYTFIASLRRKIRGEVVGTTATHSFIRQLRDQKKLVRCYTQNIDGLEARDGLSTDLDRGKGSNARFTRKAMQLPRSTTNDLHGSMSDPGCEVVQLHGDLDVVRCTLCSNLCSWEEGGSETIFLSGKAPRCQNCSYLDQCRQDRGMRGTAVGSLRPNVVLYGEEHPSADKLSSITIYDLKCGPDVLLILGTSLKVHGLKVLVREFAKAVHTRTGKKGVVVFVNLTRPPGSVWNDVLDYWVSMDCDEWVNDLRVRRPGLWLKQSVLEPKMVKRTNVPLNGHTTKKTVHTEEDKENDLPSSLVQVVKAKTPRKNGSRLIRAVDRPNKEFAKKAGPMTPSKSQQLPTPPPSREHDMIKFHQPLKYDSYEEDLIGSTPSKRRKTELDIWEDHESDAPSETLSETFKFPAEPQLIRIPQRMPSILGRSPAKSPASSSAPGKEEHGKAISSALQQRAEKFNVLIENEDDRDVRKKERDSPQDLTCIRLGSRTSTIQVRVPSSREIVQTSSMVGKKRKRL